MKTKSIGRTEIATLIHRSKVDGADNLARQYSNYKRFIITAVQYYMNQMAVKRPVWGEEFPEDFEAKIEKCNLPKDYKDILIGRTK